MSIDVVATVWNYIALRSRTGRRVESRFDCGSLIRGNVAVAHAEWKIVLAEDNVNGTLKVGGWCKDASQGQQLADRVCLLVGVLLVENCGTLAIYI